MLFKKEVAEIFEKELFHQFATSSKDGIPNICTIGAKYLRDDGKIIVVDNYMNKTLANLLENPEVAILIRREKEYYQIKGTAVYHTSGAEYDEAYKWMKSIAERYPAKGVIVISVDSVYNSNSGSGAGDRVQ